MNQDLADRLAPYREKRLSCSDMQLLFSSLEELFGERPQMVVGMPLIVRWVSTEGPVFQVIAEPNVGDPGDGSDIWWSIFPNELSPEVTLEAEHLEFRYPDPDFYEPPYVWNLSVNRERGPKAIDVAATNFGSSFKVQAADPRLRAGMTSTISDFMVSPDVEFQDPESVPEMTSWGEKALWAHVPVDSSTGGSTSPKPPLEIVHRGLPQATMTEIREAVLAGPQPF